MKRLGFFGGCFNPPTIAHIRLIEKAIEIAHLDKVYFVPMGNLYEKEGLVDEKHRINMLNLAIKNNPKLEVSDIQMSTNKKMHAIDTFKLIDRTFSESENFFIMGSDNFKNLKLWKNSEELLTNYNYIILDRGNLKNENVIIVKSTEKLKEISSSFIREQIRKNGKLDNLLLKEVKDYILENKLYK